MLHACRVHTAAAARVCDERRHPRTLDLGLESVAMSASFAKVALALVLSSAGSGCAKRAATPPGDESGPGHAARADSAECSAQKLGLGAAKRVDSWQPPAGCQGPSGGVSTPQVIRSEAEFALSFHCQPEVPSGVDFVSKELVISTRMLSPAGAGSQVFDDAQTTTIVSLFRTPCADSPMPMPMSYTLGFLLPAGATRAFAEKACTLAAQCN